MKRLPTELEPRLANWGDCWRASLKLDEANSAEGGYRSPQRRHWDTDWWVGIAPVSRNELDSADARVIELAVCALDLFHHHLLKLRYVHRLLAADGLEALRRARRTAGWRPVRESDAQARNEYAFRLEFSKQLLDLYLALPEATLRLRALARQAAALTAVPAKLTVRAAVVFTIQPPPCA